jgi:hypothetical protein
VGIVAVGADRIRLDHFRRKRSRLFLILSFVTRKQHPFADDFAPQVVFGSHLDLLQCQFPKVKATRLFLLRESPLDEAVMTVV